MAAKKRRAKKKNRALVPPQLRSLAIFLIGPGRPLVIGGTILGLFLGGCFFLWQEVQADVLAADQYRVTPDRIEITQQAEWIRSNIRADVFRMASLDDSLSILEEDLAERIATAFAMHPWVAEVHRVTKHHPALVRVDLTYRKPLCMVEVGDWSFPVDIDGVFLPDDDFSAMEIAAYPRLVGIESAPVGPMGTRWGDARVVDAAEIAAAFGPKWRDLELDRIQPKPSGQGRYQYSLFTRSGTEILWGYGPTADISDELPPSDKVKRLVEYQSQHGTLEGIHRAQTINVLDL